MKEFFNHIKIFLKTYQRAIVFSIQILATCVFLYYLYKLSFLPPLYYTVICVILVVLLIGEYFLIFIKKVHSKRSLITQVLSLFVSLVLIFVAMNLQELDHAIDLLTSESFQTRAVSVIVMNDSEILNEEGITSSCLGYVYNIDPDTMDYALKDIKNQFGPIDELTYDDFTSLTNDLYNGTVDAILLDEAFRSLIEQDHTTFGEETRVIYQVVLSETLVSAKNVDVTTSPFLVYISGNDEYGDLSAVSRSDVNMLVAVNPNTKQVLMISIPRDLYIPLARNNQYDKFTHAGIYGLDESLLTLENYLQEDINYYARLNFTSFIDIVDVLGGVTVYSPHSFVTVKGKYQINEGYNTLNAQQALSFVRERKAFLDGDFERGRNQQRMISAIIKKISSPVILTKFSSVLSTLSNSVDTNISQQEINALIQFQLSTLASWDIQSYQIAGTPQHEFCFSMGQALSVVVPDELSTQQAVQYIDDLMAGNKIQTEQGDLDQEEASTNE